MPSQTFFYQASNAAIPSSTIGFIGLAVRVTEQYQLGQQQLGCYLEMGQKEANHISTRGWRENPPYRTFIYDSNLTGIAWIAVEVDSSGLAPYVVDKTLLQLINQGFAPLMGQLQSVLGADLA